MPIALATGLTVPVPPGITAPGAVPPATAEVGRDVLVSDASICEEFESDAGSKNRPLSTGLGPATLVKVISTLPLISHCRYTPSANDETASVLSTAPVVALLSVTVSDRPALGQSRK